MITSTKILILASCLFCLSYVESYPSLFEYQLARSGLLEEDDDNQIPVKVIYVEEPEELDDIYNSKQRMDMDMDDEVEYEHEPSSYEPSSAAVNSGEEGDKQEDEEASVEDEEEEEEDESQEDEENESAEDVEVHDDHGDVVIYEKARKNKKVVEEDDRSARIFIPFTQGALGAGWAGTRFGWDAVVGDYNTQLNFHHKERFNNNHKKNYHYHPGVHQSYHTGFMTYFH